MEMVCHQQRLAKVVSVVIPSFVPISFLGLLELARI